MFNTEKDLKEPTKYLIKQNRVKTAELKGRAVHFMVLQEKKRLTNGISDGAL